MKNIAISIFVIILIAACDKIPDEIIDPGSVSSDVIITGIQIPINFTYSIDDSVLNIFVMVSNQNQSITVTFNLESPIGNSINLSNNKLMDNGNLTDYGDSSAHDKIYSGKVFFKKSYPSGVYLFSFFTKENDEGSRLAAKQNLNYFNGQANYPPVISNLDIPDSVNRGDSLAIYLNVFDANGLIDVRKVFFKSFRPDGSFAAELDMLDDGDTQVNGDLVADDGIYSRQIRVGSTSRVGIWKFEFLAIDRSDSLSNKITHNILVK